MAKLAKKVKIVVNEEQEAMDKKDAEDHLKELEK